MTQLVNKYNLSHPPNDKIERRRMKIIISDKMLKKWFNVVVDRVVSDLQTQLQHVACRNIKYLYMVGGFCMNKYLVERVTHHINTQYQASTPPIYAVCDKYLSIMLQEVSAVQTDQPFFQVRKPSHHHINKPMQRMDERWAIDLVGWSRT